MSNPILQRKSAFLWRNFLALCHETNSLKPAEDLWSDAEFKANLGYIDYEKKTMGVLMPSIAEVYLVKLSSQPFFSFKFLPMCLFLQTGSPLSKQALHGCNSRGGIC